MVVNLCVMIVVDIYFMLAMFIAGYTYKEQLIDKEKKNISLFIDSLFFGFFWFFILMYKKIKIKNNHCRNCISFNERKCSVTGKFCSKNKNACEKFKRIKK